MTARHDTFEVESQFGSFRSPLVVGSLALVCVLGAMTGWASLAPLASATIVSGTIEVSDSRKQIQHPEGGVVRAILVHDGDSVAAGQTLVSLEQSRLLPSYQAARSALALNTVQLARLQSERDGKPEFQIAALAAGLDPDEVAHIAYEQRQLMASRRAALESHVASLRSEGQQARVVAEGRRKQAALQNARIQSAIQELEGVSYLARQGDAPKLRVAQIQRTVLDLQAEATSLESQASEADHKAEQSDIDVTRARASFDETVESELQAALRDRPQLQERVTTIQDQLARLEIRAPVAGNVVNLAVHTPGGVVTPGSVILEIVPADDALVIEAHLPTPDRAGIHPGQEVNIRLKGYEGKNRPDFKGHVLTVSADRMTDRLRDVSYFVVRIEAPKQLLDHNTKNSLSPGMPVDVMIYKGSATLLGYLVDPLVSFFTRSLRE